MSESCVVIVKKVLVVGTLAGIVYGSALMEEHHRRLFYDKEHGVPIGTDTYIARLVRVAIWKTIPYTAVTIAGVIAL